MTQEYLDRPHSITFKLAWATSIICLSTLQFGFHLSELNAPSKTIPCETSSKSATFETCIPMKEHSIAIITTMYTVGGFVMSIVLGFTNLSKWYGRKSLCSASALGYCVGSAILASSNSTTGMGIGRFINGLAAGTSLIVSPILVNELTPINHRGLLGSLAQVAISLGILLGQAVSLIWKMDQWRYIFVFASILAFLQFMMLFTVTESPKWIILNVGNVQHATDILDGLRSDKETVFHEINHWRALVPASTTDPSAVTETSELLESSLQLAPKKSRRGSFEESNISAREFIFGRYNHEAMAVFVLMTSQQLVGINAIVFYGVSILSTLFTTNTLLLACSISLVNLVGAIGVCKVVDMVGRRPLLMVSAAASGICAASIAVGLIYERSYLIVGACYGFVLSYSIGIGPIPYLMISEMASHEVVSTAQAIGTSSNWAANMLIAISVPVVQNAIGGAMFYIFAAICFIYLVAVWRFVPETRGVTSSNEAWAEHRDRKY